MYSQWLQPCTATRLYITHPDPSALNPCRNYETTFTRLGELAFQAHLRTRGKGLVIHSRGFLAMWRNTDCVRKSSTPGRVVVQLWCATRHKSGVELSSEDHIVEKVVLINFTCWFMFEKSSYFFYKDIFLPWLRFWIQDFKKLASNEEIESVLRNQPVVGAMVTSNDFVAHKTKVRNFNYFSLKIYYLKILIIIKLLIIRMFLALNLGIMVRSMS